MVDSKQQKLKPAQIIDIAAKTTKSKHSSVQIKRILVEEFSLPGSWKMQQGNTIFVVHTGTKPRQGYFRAINADTARNYVENSKEFVSAAYDVGYDILVTYFTDPTILNIFKAIAATKPAHMGYKAVRTKDGGYQVTLILGPLRGKA